MAGSYRITVKGVMSERFCRGFSALSRARRAPAVPCWRATCPTARALGDVLARLDNLGLEVARGRARRPAPHLTRKDG